MEVGCSFDQDFGSNSHLSVTTKVPGVTVLSDDGWQGKFPGAVNHAGIRNGFNSTLVTLVTPGGDAVQYTVALWPNDDIGACEAWSQKGLPIARTLQPV